MIKKLMALLFAAVTLWLTACSGALAAEVHINQPVPEDWQERELLRLTVFATHKSDAMLLEVGGQTMLIDGGAKVWRKKLGEALTEMLDGKLTYIYCSHPHDDHMDAQYSLIANDVITATEYLSVFPPDYRGGEKRMPKMIKMLEKKGIPYRQLYNGDDFAMGKANIHIFRWDNADTVNAKSGVFRITFGDASILLLADLSGRGEHEYLAMFGAEAMKADIVKAPHHGIMIMVPKFLDAVDPSLVLFTNRRKDILKSAVQVENRKIPELFNEQGRIVLETDGVDWYVTQYPGVF